MRSLALFALAACSSSAPPPAQPMTPHQAPTDAAVAPGAPDAAPDISLTAPAHVFRFASTARTETWTLWFAAGVAMLNVQSANSAVTRYQGSATDGASVVIEVASTTAKLTLDCKPATRELEPACDAAATKPKPKKKPAKIRVDALDCFHADFKEPMPFGPLPGIEYVADGPCAGYRAIAP